MDRNGLLAFWIVKKTYKFEKISGDEMKALETLMVKLAMPPVHVLPRSDGNMFVDSDACDHQVR